MKTLYLHISPYNQYIIIQTIKYQDDKVRLYFRMKCIFDINQYIYMYELACMQRIVINYIHVLLINGSDLTIKTDL